MSIRFSDFSRCVLFVRVLIFHNNFTRVLPQFLSHFTHLNLGMTDDAPPPTSSMEASSTGNKSENESPTQAADKLSHLSVGSRKISLESNGSHQTSSSPGTSSTFYARSGRPHREVWVPPTQDEYVSSRMSK